jgi:hypothetical protein
MGFFRAKTIEIKIFVSVLTFLWISQGVVAFAGSGRLYPTNKVTLHRGENVVGVYTKEVPLPDGTILSTDGRCAVKLEDVYLVAEDKSVFSISTSDQQRNLFIKEGTIYFKTSGIQTAFTFLTPDGPIGIHSIKLNAAYGDASIKGYVAVNDSGTEMGIADGGSIDVYTDEGLTTIQSGNKIILAQADMDIGIPEAEEPASQEVPEVEEKKGWSKKATYITLGALGVAAAAGLAIGLSGGSSDDGGDVSPSRP